MNSSVDLDPVQPWLPSSDPSPGTVRYSEIPVTGALASIVSKIWFLTTDRADEPFPYWAVPDASPDVIFDFSTGEGFVIGSIGCGTEFAVRPGSRTVGLRLAPHALPAVVRIPAGKLADEMVSFEDLGLSSLNELFLRASQNRSTAVIASRLLDGFAHHLDPSRIDQRARGVVRAMLDKDSPRDIDRVAQDTGLSQKQLRRIARDQIGLTPKHLARVLRFQSTLPRLVSGRTNLAEIAADEGYFDQAHMNREVLALSGYSPGFWRQHGSSNFSNTGDAPRLSFAA